MKVPTEWLETVILKNEESILNYKKNFLFYKLINLICANRNTYELLYELFSVFCRGNKMQTGLQKVPNAKPTQDWVYCARTLRNTVHWSML